MALSLIVAVLLALPRLAAAIWVNFGYLDLERVAAQAGLPMRRMAQYEMPPVLDGALSRRAEQRFRRALAWWPRSPVAQLGLGEMFIWTGRYSEAAVHLEHAAALGAPRHAGMVAGSARMFLEERDIALGHWLTGASQPRDRRQLATILFGQSDWDDYHPQRWRDAIYVLQVTLAAGGLTPAEAAAQSLQLSDMHQHMGQLEQAELVLRTALNDAPENSRLLAALSWVLQNQGKGDDALQTAQAALDLAPEWRAYYVAGREYLNRCQLAAAAHQFQRGLEQRPDEYRFHWQLIGLGEVYWEMAEEEKAIQTWEAYLRIQTSARLIERLALARRNELSRHCTPP